MSDMNGEIDCWPTWQQELLLQAALLQGSKAVSAWEKWRSSVDIEKLDGASNNILPLLYNNLITLGINDPLMDNFKGIYRQTWYKNQLSIHRAATLLNSFHNAGIRTMLLKGAALVLLHYKNHGLRPMGDIDLLVHINKASEAIDFLMKSGWISELESPESQIAVSHGIAFTNPATDQAIDLHWHVIHECRQPNADDKFWEGAVALKINEVTTCALSPADQLLHIFAHGIKWNPVPPFRWIADAMTVVRSSHSVIEWNRLITLAKEHRLVLPVRDALDYLGDKLDAPLPLYVLQTLKNIPTSRIERMEYKYKTENYLQKPLGYMPVIWFDYSRLSRDKTLPLKVIGFVRYLQSFWGAESIWRLPIYAISMTGRKLRSIKDYYWRG